jgi:hypothetical protein
MMFYASNHMCILHFIVTGFNFIEQLLKDPFFYFQFRPLMILSTLRYFLAFRVTSLFIVLFTLYPIAIYVKHCHFRIFKI